MLEYIATKEHYALLPECFTMTDLIEKLKATGREGYSNPSVIIERWVANSYVRKNDDGHSWTTLKMVGRCA